MILPFSTNECEILNDCVTFCLETSFINLYIIKFLILQILHLILL